VSGMGTVRVSVDVAVEPHDAFEVFTDHIGVWYKRDAYSLVDPARTKTLRFEPRVGGRFLDVYDLATGEGRELGRIVAWDPPARFSFLGARGIEVEVTFEPAPTGCRVTVEERGLDRLSPSEADHVRRWGWHATLPGMFADHVRRDPTHERNDTAMTDTLTLGTIVPYLFYDDVEAALDWYARVFGFVELGRWAKDGKVHNAEMTVGGSELWLDGGGRRFFDKDGEPASQWIGVWVDDPDAMYARVKDAGVAVDPPQDQSYGVRTLTVKDPEGYSWGFMRRIEG
jgi:uncharacterized glyoxalase superfamily protein PhnB